MDEQNIYGIKYEVDIESLKTSTSEATKQIRMANAEFNESSSKLENWATSVEGVEAKIKQLNTILDAEKSKLANSQKQYNDTIDKIEKYQNSIDELKQKKEQAIQQYGAESKEVKDLNTEIKKLERQQAQAVKSADNLKVSIANQQASINRTERSVNKYEGELKDLKQAQQQAEKSGRSLEDELHDIKNASDEAGDAVGGMSEGFTVFKGAVANVIGNAVSNFISGIGNMIEESKEFTEDMGKLETAFTTSGHSAETATAVYRDMVGILGETDQAVEASNHLAKLTKSQEDLQKWTTISAGVYATFGDSLPLEGLTEASNETAKVGQVTGVLADALNWAGVSEDDFNKKLEACNNEQERSKLITDTLNDLYKEASDTYREINGNLIENRQATSDLAGAQAEVGKALMPLDTAFKNFQTTVINTFTDLLTGKTTLSEVANSFSNFVETAINKVSEKAPEMLNKGIEMITNLSEGFIQGYPDFMAKMYDFILQIGQYLAENAPSFIQKGFEILSNLVEGIINAIPVMIEKIPQIITTFANIINDNFPTILAKGAELLWQFITGIIGAIPTLIANIPQIIEAIVATFMAFNWLNLGSNIIQFLGNGIKSMIGFIGSVSQSIFNTVVNFIKNLPSTLLNLGSQAISFLGNAFSSGVGSISGAVSRIASAVINGVASLPSQMLSIGKNIVQGLWNGINGMIDWVVGKVASFGSSILDGIKGVLGINSPSKETFWMGEMLTQGLANAIDKTATKVNSRAKKMADGVLETMQSELNTTIPVQTKLIGAKNKLSGALNGIQSGTFGNDLAIAGAGNVNNVTFNQYNTSPKALNSLEMYRNQQRQVRQLKKWLGGK